MAGSDGPAYGHLGNKQPYPKSVASIRAESSRVKPSRVE